MPGQYLPLFRPGDTVTFDVTAAVEAGDLLEVGDTDRSVAPAAAETLTYVGVAGHSAAVGDKVTVEVGRPIHEFIAAGAVTRGDLVAAAGGKTVATAADASTATGLALTSAVDGAAVEVLQV